MERKEVITVRFNIVVTPHDTSFLCYEAISQLPGITLNAYYGVMSISGELQADNQTAAEDLVHTLEQSEYIDHIVLGKSIEETNEE